MNQYTTLDHECFIAFQWFIRIKCNGLETDIHRRTYVVNNVLGQLQLETYAGQQASATSPTFLRDNILIIKADPETFLDQFDNHFIHESITIILKELPFVNDIIAENTYLNLSSKDAFLSLYYSYFCYTNKTRLIQFLVSFRDSGIYTNRLT